MVKQRDLYALILVLGSLGSITQFYLVEELGKQVLVEVLAKLIGKLNKLVRSWGLTYYAEFSARCGYGLLT